MFSSICSAVLAALTGAWLTIGAPAGVPAPRCANPPPPASVIAEVPWPQQRYDLAALAGITDGTGVTVAVVDSGVDPSHPQLATAVAPGVDLLDRTGDGRDDCLGHGTAVASIIAARAVAGAGLRGLAPGARILPVRVSERVENDGAPSGDGTIAGLAAGIRAAAASRPKPAVINLSIYTTTDNPALRAAVQAALDADIVVVAAAGNLHDRGDPTPYPASYDGVVGVGAIGPDNARVASSSIGSYVDIVAPGDAVVGAAPHRGHQTYQGTSFATPFVAATAALIRAHWPNLDRTGVVHRLLATADPPAGGPLAYGHGVLNPVRALTAVVAPVADVPAPAPVLVPGSVATLATPAAANTRVLVIAGVLVLGAATVATVGFAIPSGRRRRWHPGP
jgi:membrane-anchored mycosin MYCP